MFKIINTSPKIHVSAIYGPPGRNLKLFEEESFRQINDFDHGLVAGNMNVDWMGTQSEGVRRVPSSLGWTNYVTATTRP